MECRFRKVWEEDKEMNEPRKLRDPKCKHDGLTPVKVSKSRTLLKCVDCDYVIGSWEEVPQHSKPKEIIPPVRKLTNRELESLR